MSVFQIGLVWRKLSGVEWGGGWLMVDVTEQQLEPLGTMVVLWGSGGHPWGG